MDDLSAPPPAPSGDAPVGADTTSSARPVQAMALGRFYLLAVATLGAYLVLWVYRTARALQPRREDRAKCVAWAVASIIAPFSCVLLYELARMVRAEGRRLGVEIAVFPLLPAAFLGALAAGLFFTPLQPLWSPAWWLVPFPFLLVQRAVNRLVAASPPRHPEGASTIRRRLAGIVLVVGLPGAAVLGFVVDRPAAAVLMARSPLAGEQVSGKTQRYTLEMPDEHWRKVPPGTNGDDTSDLELVHEDGAAWLVVYVREGTSDTLDRAVADRRAAIGGDSPIQDFYERRIFRDKRDFVPESIARYDLGGFPARRTFWALTTIVEQSAFEVLVYSSNPDTNMKAVSRLMASLKIEPARGAAP